MRLIVYFLIFFFFFNITHSLASDLSTVLPYLAFFIWRRFQESSLPHGCSLFLLIISLRELSIHSYVVLGYRINSAAHGASIHLLFPAAFHLIAYASFEPAHSVSKC